MIIWLRNQLPHLNDVPDSRGILRAEIHRNLDEVIDLHLKKIIGVLVATRERNSWLEMHEPRNLLEL